MGYPHELTPDGFVETTWIAVMLRRAATFSGPSHFAKPRYDPAPVERREAEPVRVWDGDGDVIVAKARYGSPMRLLLEFIGAGGIAAALVLARHAPRIVREWASLPDDVSADREEAKPREFVARQQQADAQVKLLMDALIQEALHRTRGTGWTPESMPSERATHEVLRHAMLLPERPLSPGPRAVISDIHFAEDDWFGDDSLDDWLA